MDENIPIMHTTRRKFMEIKSQLNRKIETLMQRDFYDPLLVSFAGRPCLPKLSHRKPKNIVLLPTTSYKPYEELALAPATVVKQSNKPTRSHQDRLNNNLKLGFSKLISLKIIQFSKELHVLEAKTST